MKSFQKSEQPAHINLTLKSLLLLALVEAQKILAEKDEQLAIMAPKADFFDAVASSKDAIDLGSAAKVLNMGIGRNRLFEILREEKGAYEQQPTLSKFLDSGYFRTIEQVHRAIRKPKSASRRCVSEGTSITFGKVIEKTA